MWVLITGASGGIGYHLALEFAKRKNNLILIARSADKLEKISQEITASYGVKVIVISSDLSVSGAPDTIFKQLSDQDIHPEVLVNNAGFGLYGYFSETNWKLESDMIMLNMHALTHLTKLFLPAMIQNKNGYILNVASVAAFMPGPLMAVYYASKAYVLSFSQALSAELKGSGVSVTVLCPGPVTTGFEEKADLKGSGLFSLMKPASAIDVAKYAYRATMKRRLVLIHRLIFKILIFSLRFTPISFVTKALMVITKKK